MDSSELIAALSDPGTYGPEVDRVEVIHTHASVVFLAGAHAYKIKKPVDLGFLDYSTLARRREMCERELLLNRRLAPRVYLQVVPIAARQGGGVELGGDGEVVEYAVQMERLPEAATMAHRVAAGTLDSRTVGRVAGRIAAFHLESRGGPDVAKWAGFEGVRANAEDNFTALRAHVPQVTSSAWLERIARASADELRAQRSEIEQRARAGVARDGHGDLRLEHVYLLPPDDEICIVDCIEFNDGFRCADPVADIAFLAMDLQAHGAWESAQELLFAYFAASGDAGGEALVPFYLAYRSMVRAKVRALQATAPGMPEDDRDRALALARAHIQTAAVELLPPQERPCIVLVAGLPGTGKSVLARGLAECGNFRWLQADAIRKELAGLDVQADGHAGVREGIYTPAWNDRTYGECARRARELVGQGQRVIIDASFKAERRRQQMFEVARDCGAPLRILVCSAKAEVVRDRLAKRKGDASDADWDIYNHVRATWEPFGRETGMWVGEVDCGGTAAVALREAADLLYLSGLMAGEGAAPRRYGCWPREPRAGGGGTSS